jgi:CRP-like cAMP-binding protein
MDRFIEYLQSTSFLSQDSLAELISLFKIEHYPAKKKLLIAGNTTKISYFLDDGIVRSYSEADNGKIYTRKIYTKPTLFSSYSALIQKTKSLYTIECLTDCKIIECDYLELVKLSYQNKEVAILIRKFLESLFVSYTERNCRFLTLNATERYLYLRKENINIDKLVSQKIIASNIGITPVQLSRIRKKIDSKNLIL